MCGIAGIIDYSGTPIDHEVVERMTNALAHRGPDGFGYYRGTHAVVGHRRLSIIDLDGGAQPIGNEDDSIQVVFNGEIYNYIELRNELVALGHVFKTRSDTEVIVHAYEQWDTDCFNRFNGMFALAIVDTRKRKVLLARDHLGIKPLYFAKIGTQLVFASEIKSLLAHPGSRRALDVGSLADLFTFRYVPSPNTLLQGVRKLPPGHWMAVSEQGETPARFWQTVPKHRHGEKEEDLVAEYQALLESAVELQLRSDVPLGLFLSSGVDSGVLLALMSARSSLPVEAFTIDFEEGGATNEADAAARVAKRFGANHHSMRVTAADYASYFDRYMMDIEEPVGHESAPAFYFVSKLARERVKVALTGQGADEPWAGYGRYVGVKLSTLYSRLPAFATQAIAGLTKRLPLRSERIRRGVVSIGERDTLLRFVKIYSFFNDEMKAQLYKDELKQKLDEMDHLPANCLRALHGDVAHLDPLSQILYLDTRTNLPDDLLMVGDKTSMANSLELRVPLLDVRLIELIESLPPGLKLSGVTGKYLHKKALLKWLPREDVYRRKIGFANPIGKWFRTSLRPLVDECLLSSSSRISEYFDQRFVQNIVEQDRQGRENFTRHIYLLLSLELWHRAFIK